MRFEFVTAARIVFGPGSIRELAAAARSFGTRALFVAGLSTARTAGPVQQLEAAGMAASEFHVSGEPTVESVLAGVEQARAHSCELVIGLGGGSVIDTAKAISVLLSNPGDI